MVTAPSSCHTASAACGSIGLLCSAGVSYVQSTVTWAFAKAPSKSPWELTAG